MKIYIDADFHCHATNPDGNFREVEHPFFDGKCAEFIEGFCCDDSNDYVQIYARNRYAELDATQREYERQMLAEYESALAEIEKALGV